MFTHGDTDMKDSLHSSIPKELEDDTKVASVGKLIVTQMAWCGCPLMRDV
jgi:hypothetical protein